MQVLASATDAFLLLPLVIRMDGFPEEFGDHLSQTSLFAHEEVRQAVEHKSAVALDPRSPIFVRQALGKNNAAIVLRKEMKPPIGLMALQTSLLLFSAGSSLD